MAAKTCSVRWRPSGGRGEYEVVPAKVLEDREISVEIPAFKVTVPAEIIGTISQGKPRLRKHQPNNRSKLHLVPLVMALARLPDPAREDKTGKAIWPLENKGFLVSHMDFEIVRSNASSVTLKPTVARILHSDEAIDLNERFANIASDIADVAKWNASNPQLAAAIKDHHKTIVAAVNDKSIRLAADAVIKSQADAFGVTNTASLSTISNLPPTPLEEDIKGKEGRILTRLHSYRERDRTLVKKAKELFKKAHGKVFCECCGFEPHPFYGDRGEDRIQAHHRLPVEEILPDSITRPEDLAMVCPNCHDIIHAERPWITVEDLRADLVKRGIIPS